MSQPTGRRSSPSRPQSQSNNLLLITNKTKELVVDFRKHKDTTHASLVISGEAVEQVGSLKYLGVHLSEDLTWGVDTRELVKKAEQRLYFLWSLWVPTESPQPPVLVHHRKHPEPKYYQRPSYTPGTDLLCPAEKQRGQV